ncbi:MAG: hypothetical protein F6J96_29160 [Symploca sp. SIO1C2]|nr:hypothetical protein [Symploca sp. SIO1C2]
MNITGYLSGITGCQHCNRLAYKHYRLWYARASHDNRDCSLASHETGHHPLYLTPSRQPISKAQHWWCLRAIAYGGAGSNRVALP